jgi:hypothetical protein
MRLLFGVVCALLSSSLTFAKQNSPEEALNLVTPPATVPIQLETKFYLLSLNTVSERNETFNADIYLRFKWRDERLAFVAQEGESAFLVYTEEAAAQKLQTIWRPELEFVNTEIPEITNRTLFIYPDGSVDYLLGVTSTFRSRFDFRSFPFDRQQLTIQIRSFIWDEGVMEFVTSAEDIDFARDNRAVSKSLSILNVEGKTVAELKEWGETTKKFSNYYALISVKRNSIYYIYQVFIPIAIIMCFAFAIFFTPHVQLSNRISLGLTCLLVFMATKFTINAELPKIGYVTFVDRVFFLSYLCVGVILLICIIESILLRRNPNIAARWDKKVRWMLPLLFAFLFLFFVFHLKG